MICNNNIKSGLDFNLKIVLYSKMIKMIRTDEK